jgi:hypothetical protein
VVRAVDEERQRRLKVQQVLNASKAMIARLQRRLQTIATRDQPADKLRK